MRTNKKTWKHIQIPRNDGLSINIHNIGCLYINHADLSILDILCCILFGTKSRKESQSWLNLLRSCGHIMSVFNSPTILWKTLCLTILQHVLASKRWPKIQCEKKNTQCRTTNYVIRMMISKGDTTLIRLIWHFWLRRPARISTLPCFSVILPVKEGMNLGQYHPGVLDSPHQPLKNGLLGDCFPFGARPSLMSFCYVSLEKRMLFSTASLRSFSKLGMVYSFHMLE